MFNNNEELMTTLEKVKSTADYVCAKMNIYVRALDQIAQADDQANPIALRNKARIALIQEPTTADGVTQNIKGSRDGYWEPSKESIPGESFGGDTGTDADFLGPNDPGDEHHESAAQLALDEMRIREDAEAAWRNTVLHPEYKSEYDEEE